MDISVVIPLYNEEESLPELFSWIERVMEANGFSHEVIFVNDGSTDRSWQVIEELKQQHPDVVKGIKFRRNYGKSPALYCGFQKAEGDVVITMDADLQDSPDEIPELYRMITVEGYDLVSGWKKKRYDPLSKTIPTKLFNATARRVSGIKNLHDFNCGLKAYRRDVVKNIEVYGEMHRYIPYLAKNAGFKKIGEKVVHHQARKFGKTKFGGLNRFFNGYLDLISLWFLSTFGIQAHALFRLSGVADVHLRLHRRHHRGNQQAVLHVQRHALPAGDRVALLLPVADGHDYRYAALRGRLPGRTDLAQRTRTQQVSNRENHLT